MSPGRGQGLLVRCHETIRRRTRHRPSQNFRSARRRWLGRRRWRDTLAPDHGGIEGPEVGGSLRRAGAIGNKEVTHRFDAQEVYGSLGTGNWRTASEVTGIDKVQHGCGHPHVHRYELGNFFEAAVLRL